MAKNETKEVTIYVEGTPHPWSKDEISYEEAVTLEEPSYADNPNITYSVTYKRGQGNKPEGTLVAGASVKIKDGMRFSVSETGQS
ncbi:multiubiquitin domain-containing protein [Sphingomicrobium astaxanthinifaciens]|uniref:multiubiquitin domain-containing protein n=1 Tax=Sphingomicrobium astaxanthinifaciens TaxID=1227949 RepID=UPI001FCC5D35|nr:multiubiquitin domain-containing protein [Sphingomicrobium astaxanthinifaciens]MCJ7420449.1 multiubiquitin domain-containing protein [Sphingomicrobium astaxanthinifaciens]